MTTLTVQQFSESGLKPTLSTADTAAGNNFDNSLGSTILLIQNTDATNSATVTVTAQATSESVEGFGTMTKANDAITLAAGEIWVMGPFPKDAFNDASDLVSVTYSGTGDGSLKVAALKGKELQKV